MQNHKVVEAVGRVEITTTGGNAETRRQFITLAINRLIAAGEFEVRGVERDKDEHRATVEVSYRAFCEPDTPPHGAN